MNMETSVNELSTWRLIFSGPADGATNMAVDEAILQEVSAGRSPATLRFYAWSPPCLSLGMAQPHAEVDRERLAALGWDLVRRPTGGRAILHADELTYSVIAPQDEPRVAGSIIESYRRLSAGLIRGLELLGLHAAERNTTAPPRESNTNPICFEVPANYEIVVEGKKLIGSAQARKDGVVLQHGALPLVGDLSRICEALVFDDAAAREAVRARLLDHATTLDRALGRVIAWETAATTLAEGCAQALNLNFRRGDLTDAEREAAATLRAAKYASPAWTERR